MSLYTYKYIIYVCSDALLHDSTPQDQKQDLQFSHDDSYMSLHCCIEGYPERKSMTANRMIYKTM